MLDPSLLAGQLATGAGQAAPQSLPNSPADNDAERFRNLLGNSQGDVKSDVLQLVGQDTKVDTAGGLTDRLIQQAGKLDSQYFNLADNAPSPFTSPSSAMRDIDNFSGIDSQKLRTYPANDVQLGKSEFKPEDVIDQVKDSYRSQLTFMSDLRAWSKDFNVWTSTIQLVASAAGKVSQGFQTLFRASG